MSIYRCFVHVGVCAQCVEASRSYVAVIKNSGRLLVLAPPARRPADHLGKVRSRPKLQRPVICMHRGAVQSLSSIGQCLYVGIISALEAKMAPRRHPDSPPRGIFLYILNYTAARPFSRAFRRYKGDPLKVKGAACSAVLRRTDGRLKTRSHQVASTTSRVKRCLTA